MPRIVKGFAAVALVLLSLSGSAWAQATAQLSGVVRDSSGAVLPGATVTATQTDTTFSRTVVTDGDGSYVMPNLPTGPYRLEVALQGFRTSAQTGIVLQVNASPVINAVLALGSLEETVTVEASTPLVDVQSAGISDVVENQRIVELPLQGRNATDLIILAGAATPSGSGNNVGISVAGGLNFGVTYTLDGATHNSPQSNQNLALPFPDALQEFSVATSGLAAENGMHSAASVNAVTKSGTNRYAGNLFEFLRHSRFNATNPFAKVGPDGTRLDDGLHRNQFGGTLGGPIVRNKLFFFGGYQGTLLRQTPAANIAWVPTAAMLAGDFTAFASPACNGGRQVTLRAPFVNNRVDPRLFSPAGVALASHLPKTDHPCGEVTYTVPNDSNGGQAVGRIDYQLSTNHTVFGRYIANFSSRESAYAKTGNILAISVGGSDSLAQAFTVADTVTFGSNMVNSLNVTVNRSSSLGYQPDFFEPRDLGAKVYSYQPHSMNVSVRPGFNIIGSAGANHSDIWNDTYQVADDFTVVRGRHQLAVGANVAFWRVFLLTDSRAGGQWIFDGSATGLALADLLMGRVAALEHGAKGGPNILQWYTGAYAQDSWRATDRVTVNAGLRWEPYFGQHTRNGAIYNFSLDNFRKGVESTVFLNAPAGLLYPGDPGFPSGNLTGLNKQWWNLSPRISVAWDVSGDGRTALRSSYGMSYDFNGGTYHFVNSSAPPFSNRSRIEDPPGRMDDPYGHIGGDPHPIVTGPNTVFPRFGGFGAMDPDINSPRVQSWNVTVERQFATGWAISASYLGSASDRLWNLVAINPGVYLGLDPCTINRVFYPVCTINGNLNNRRVLYLENPQQAQYIGALDEHTDLGVQDYHGLKLSFRRRAGTGVSLNGNYTWSHCEGNTTPEGFSQIGAGYVKPDDPAYDSGHCDQDRHHLANLSIGVETPEFVNPALRALASHWRLAGIFTARSGRWLNVIIGRDNAFTGQANQRPNQISDQLYADGMLANYLNRAAFAIPAPGTHGDSPRNSVEGPGFRTVDVALSRLLSFGATRSLELRAEAFNLFNNFNWGDPNTTFTAATFGRITSMSGDPRILQFGVKYGF